MRGGSRLGRLWGRLAYSALCGRLHATAVILIGGLRARLWSGDSLSPCAYAFWLLHLMVVQAVYKRISGVPVLYTFLSFGDYSRTQLPFGPSQYSCVTSERPEQPPKVTQRQNSFESRALQREAANNRVSVHRGHVWRWLHTPKPPFCTQNSEWQTVSEGLEWGLSRA